jgi:hypothetical protein
MAATDDLENIYHDRTQASRPQNDIESYDIPNKGSEAGHTNYHGIDTQTVQPGADGIYERKVATLNEALIDLGMGSYQWKVFLTTGLGWFVDNVSFSYLWPEETWLIIIL